MQEGAKPMTLDQLSADATEAQRLLPEFYLSPFYKTEYERQVNHD